MANIVISQAGPLPIEVSYTHVNMSEILVMLSGSVWSNDIACKIGIKLSINGKEITTSEIFSNIATQHRTTTPSYVNTKLPFDVDEDGNVKPITVRVEAMNSQTIGDQNDDYTVVFFGDYASA